MVKKRALTTTLSTVTAAVVGVVLNLAVWFGFQVVFPSGGGVDWFAILVGTVAFIGMVHWRWDIVPVVLSAGFAGLRFKTFSNYSLMWATLASREQRYTPNLSQIMRAGPKRYVIDF